MLTLSVNQVHDLWLAGIRETEDRLVQLLREHVEPQCEFLGDDRLRYAVRETIVAGADHQLRTERALGYYAAVVVMFGFGLVEDPQYPWARACVRVQAPEEPDYARARHLFDRAMAEADRFNGRDDRGYARVLVRVRALDPEVLAAQPVPGEHALAELLRSVCPDKCEALGDPTLQAFVASARTNAESFGLVDPFGVRLHVVLSLLLGTTYYRDPFHPWAVARFEGASERCPVDAAELHADALQLLYATNPSLAPRARSTLHHPPAEAPCVA